MFIKGKLILDTDLCKIIQTKDKYILYIKLSESPQFIEHNPFPGDLRGLVAALSLAVEVSAGKFFPAKVVSNEPEKSVNKLKLLTNDNGDLLA